MSLAFSAKPRPAAPPLYCRGGSFRFSSSGHLPHHPIGLARVGNHNIRVPTPRRASSSSPSSVAVTTAAATSEEKHEPSSQASSSYLVTGAAGFIGSHLVEALLSNGAAVIAVDSLDEGGPYPKEWKQSNVALLRRVAERHESEGARLLFQECDAGDREGMRELFFASGDDDGGGDSGGGGGGAGTVPTTPPTPPMPPVTRVCHLGGGVTLNLPYTTALTNQSNTNRVLYFPRCSSAFIINPDSKKKNRRLKKFNRVATQTNVDPAW